MPGARRPAREDPVIYSNSMESGLWMLNKAETKTLTKIRRGGERGVETSRLDARHLGHLSRHHLIRFEGDPNQPGHRAIALPVRA